MIRFFLILVSIVWDWIWSREIALSAGWISVVILRCFWCDFLVMLALLMGGRCLLYTFSNGKKMFVYFSMSGQLGGTRGSLLVLAVWLGGCWRELAGCRWEISLLLWPLFVFFGCVVVLCCIKKRKKNYLWSFQKLLVATGLEKKLREVNSAHENNCRSYINGEWKIKT